MAFDLSSVLESAAKAVEGNNSRENKYPLFYPGVGTSKLKLLYNPKSNSVMRLINRHEWLDKKKVPCMKNFGKDMECPICKLITDVKNAKGIDLARHKSKVRGIAFAQLISTNYPLTGKNAPKEGDIVLFMFPWMVYQQLQQTINEAHDAPPEHLQQLIATNEGYTFTINHSEDNKYQTMMNPFTKTKTCGSEEEFEKLLNDLDSLNNMIVPEDITDEIKDNIFKVADEMRLKFLDVTSNGEGHSLSQAAENARDSVKNSINTKKEDYPDCFGKIGDESIDENKCLMCPFAVECQSRKDALGDLSEDDLPF